jgi:hypothetical protein
MHSLNPGSRSSFPSGSFDSLPLEIVMCTVQGECRRPRSTLRNLNGSTIRIIRCGLCVSTFLACSTLRYRILQVFDGSASRQHEGAAGIAAGWTTTGENSTSALETFPDAHAESSLNLSHQATDSARNTYPPLLVAVDDMSFGIRRQRHGASQGVCTQGLAAHLFASKGSWTRA